MLTSNLRKKHPKPFVCTNEQRSSKTHLKGSYVTFSEEDRKEQTNSISSVTLLHALQESAPTVTEVNTACVHLCTYITHLYMNLIKPET